MGHPSGSSVVQPLRNTPGLIIVPTGDVGRYTQFWGYLSQLQRPPGTGLAVVNGVNIAENFNNGLRELRQDWVQLWGDDHTFSPDLLLNLLGKLDEHPEADIIVPLCLKRHQPFYPPLGVRWWETDHGSMAELPLAMIPPPGELFEVRQAGLPGAVIRRRVIEAVGDPWFSWNTLYDTTRSPHVILRAGEDYEFCRRVCEKGFRIFVDTASVLGHIISPQIVPRWNGKRWVVDIVLDNKILSTMTQEIVK